MTRTQTMVQLTDELVARLDAEAHRLGTSRSAVIRTAVEEHLRATGEAATTEQIVQAYRRMPQGTPDEWGDPGVLADRSTLETLQRLDAEERDAGCDPW